MLTIGFTSVYYTLWSVKIWTRYGANGSAYEVTSYAYLQNLSMDLEAAKDKINKMSNGLYDIDLTLRGEWGTRYDRERMIKDMDIFRFSFGKLQGQDIREATDVWQLERAMNQEPNIKRRVYARRRMIDLGELVRRNWLETVSKAVGGDNWDMDNMENNFIKVCRKWMPKRLAKYYTEVADRMGHFFEDGKRIEMQVKQIRSKYIDTAYGTMWIITYETSEGQVVTYKGSTLPNISKTEFTTIKATVKHDEYKGTKQTLIQRIKVAQTA